MPCMCEHSFEGELLGMANSRIFGWVKNNKKPSYPVALDLLGDEILIDTFLAHPQSTIKAGDQIIDHAFSYLISHELSQSCGTLTVKVSNSEKILKGEVKTNQFEKNLNVVNWEITNHGSLHFFGYWIDPNEPSHKSVLRFRLDNCWIGQVTCNEIRPDLVEWGDDGRFGFEFSLPLEYANGDTHLIDIFDEKGIKLNKQAYAVCSTSINPIQLIKQTSNTKENKVALNLAEKVIADYQHYLPNSVPFNHYNDWYQLFVSSRKSSVCNRTVILLVMGDGDVIKTLKSILDQTHRLWKAYVIANPSDVKISDERISYINEDEWEKVYVQHAEKNQTYWSWIASGDSISPNALSIVLDYVNKENGLIFYTDVDFESSSASDKPAWFKPDWDMDFFIQTPLLNHLTLIDCSLMCFEAIYAQPSHWVWQALIQLKARKTTENWQKKVIHIPYPVYHYADSSCLDLNHKLLKEYLPLLSEEAVLNDDHKLNWAVPKRNPKVTIIIPTRDQLTLLQKCISSLNKTDYTPIEIMVINHDSGDSATLQYLDQLKKIGISVINYSGLFNFSAINNLAAFQASGEVLCFLNNDTEVINTNWLTELVKQLLRNDVAIVGAKLLWRNQIVQHAGVILGMHGLAGHIGNLWYSDDPGYYNMNQIVRPVSAVTAACLLIKKEDFVKVGGFDEKYLAVNFNDVDLCLKVTTQLNKKVLWTPHAKLWHEESASRGNDNESRMKKSRRDYEIKVMRNRWGNKLYQDPFYNPNLNLDRYSHMALAMPPRIIEKRN